MRRSPITALIALLMTFSLAGPAFGDVVLLDTFEDDTPGNPPNGPEIGIYAQITGDHYVFDDGGNLKLRQSSQSTSSGAVIVWEPTTGPEQMTFEYDFRIEGNTNPVGANAVYQSLTLRPLGLNLWVEWGNDFLVRVYITYPGGGSNMLTSGFSWAFDTDYHVIVRTDAATDTFDLIISGTPVWVDEPIGDDLEWLWRVNTGINFPTTGSVVIDNVTMNDTTDPCINETTPPIAELTAPPELGSGCTCNPATVSGSAYDPDGTFEQYTVQYRKTGASAWTTIATSTTPVISGTLATWDTTGLTEGYYVVRLTATNICGMANTDARVVFLDKDFSSLELRYPTEGLVVARDVCLDGTVYDSWCFDSYTAEYRPAAGGPFIPVDPNFPVYTTSEINDPFATWATTTVPDGDYELLVSATTVCGNEDQVRRLVTVDNTAPTSEITSPEPCVAVEGSVKIIGTANDAHLDMWVLEFTGGGWSGWNTIATGTSPVIDDVLGTWDTTLLPDCPYTLRLRVYDTAKLYCNSALRQRTDYLVSVNIGYCGDFDVDNDGDVDMLDFSVFETAFTGPLP